MMQVLRRVFVARFYRINAGLFLVLFLLLFGIMNGRDTIRLHYGIMQAITSSAGFFCTAALLWLLYNVKCISFFSKQLHDPANSFLFELQAVSGRQQFMMLLSTHAAVYLPALVYSILAAGVGLVHGHILLPVLMLLFQVLMCACGAAIHFYQLNGTWKKPAFTIPLFDVFRKKGFMSWLLHYSMYYRKGTFAGVKILSLLLLQAMLAANSNKLSREAVCVLIMFIISAHALLPLYYVRYTEQEIGFLRNIPLSLAMRFSMFVFTYMVIFLPELLFLVCNGYNILPVSVICSLYAVAVSQLALYTSVLYFSGMTTERYTMLVAGLFFATLLYVASFDLWPLFIAEAILAVVVFMITYDRYEAIAEQKRD